MSLTMDRPVDRKLVRALVRQGIPDHYRGTVWMRLSGADALLARFPGVYTKLQSPELKTKWDAAILRDIGRTFPTHMYFRERKGCGQQALFNVLRAYAVYDRKLGYCQGMGFVAGLLLCYLGEEEAFWLLVTLLTHPRFALRGMYEEGMPLLTQQFYVLERLLDMCLPALFAHLRRQDAQVASFASSWFMTLFSYAFPLPCVLRVWDIFLLEGPRTLFRVAVAVLHKAEEGLLSRGLEGILIELKRVQSGFTADGLVAALLNVHLPARLLPSLVRELESKRREERTAGAATTVTTGSSYGSKQKALTAQEG